MSTEHNNNRTETRSPTTTSSSSSSSIYSSPNNTPISQKTLLQNNPSPENLSKHDLGSPTTKEQPTQRYEELMKQTKSRMNDKFEQLEKETGLVLNNESQDHECSNNANSNSINNECSTKAPDYSQQPQPTTRLKESQYLFMEKEITRLKDELILKNEIINKMCKIRSQVESELEDLTASLFEEANKMVYEANVLRDRAEKELYEANLKIDMLTAEVQALKLLVITSTPSRPNAHLHPQLNHSSNNNNNSGGHSHKKQNNSPSSHLRTKSSLPIKSPSNYELGDRETNSRNQDPLLIDDDPSARGDERYCQQSSIGELDPVFFEEFNEWRKCPTFEAMNSNFMKRIYDEEIYPVFNFKNKHLTSLVLRSIENNTLTVEAINSDKLPFPKKCALLEVPRVCRYRMKIIDEDGQWHYISQLCRNRITTVCDLFCYLRYVQDGLVKSNPKDMFWHIMKRRRNIALSKLGFLPNNF